MKRFELVLYTGAVIHAPGETVLLLLPEDERPLQGNAGWIDWRLRGAVSRHLAADFLKGGSNEAALITAGPPLQATRLLALGIGPKDSLVGYALERTMAEASDRLLALNVPEALLALPGAIDLESEAEIILRGLLRGLAERPGATSLRMVVPDADRHHVSLELAASHLLVESHRANVVIDIQIVKPDPSEPVHP